MINTPKPLTRRQLRMKARHEAIMNPKNYSGVGAASRFETNKRKGYCAGAFGNPSTRRKET